MEEHMEQAASREVHRIPLYRVLQRPLSLQEVTTAVGLSLQKHQGIVEVHFKIEGMGKACAVGIFQGSTQIPMKHLFLRCDYHEPPGHFIAIEEDEVGRMMALFPERLQRVGNVYESPYL
jgi:hypothetical protein